MENMYLNKLLEIQGKARIEWDDTEGFKNNLNNFRKRQPLVDEYAWAIPNDEALDAIIALGRDVVEIGAGKGYWGRLLRDRGVTCHLYDVSPPKEVWSWVQVGSVEKAMLHNDCALLLCWPPYSESMAHECLQWYCGDYVIYVGEWNGCTADDTFHSELEEHWNLLNEILIPQWFGLHDYMSIFERRKSCH